MADPPAVEVRLDGVPVQCPACPLHLRLNRAGRFPKHGHHAVLPGVIAGNRLLGLPAMKDARTSACRTSGLTPLEADDAR